MNEGCYIYSTLFLYYMELASAFLCGHWSTANQPVIHFTVYVFYIFMMLFCRQWKILYWCVFFKCYSMWQIFYPKHWNCERCWLCSLTSLVIFHLMWGLFSYSFQPHWPHKSYILRFDYMNVGSIILNDILKYVFS